MMIAIGELCSTKAVAERPNALVFATGIARNIALGYATNYCKVYHFDDVGLYAVGAGDIEMTDELIALVHEALRDAEATDSTGIKRLLNRAVHECFARQIQFDALPEDLRPPDDDLPRDEGFDMLEAWREQGGIQVAIGTFDDEGRALLYTVGRREGTPGYIHRVAFPGAAVVGFASYDGAAWLHYRGQNSELEPELSAYHAYEAVRFTLDRFGGVPHFELLTAGKDRFTHLTESRPDDDAVQPSLRSLSALFEQYGPRSTLTITSARAEAAVTT